MRLLHTCTNIQNTYVDMLLTSDNVNMQHNYCLYVQLFYDHMQDNR